MSSADPGADFLALTPAGHLRSSDGAVSLTPALLRVHEAFGRSEAAGLFELAAHAASGGLPPAAAFWRDFAARYLTERCHTPSGTSALEPVQALPEADKTSFLLGAPPMPGAEYLDANVLDGLWASLDLWVRGRAAEAGGLEPFLQSSAPLWRQVGRVCFHLAENKKDPEYPFAFMVTYAPRLAESARVRYQPLSRALQEFAGERNRKALVHLLTPIQSAAEKSALIRDLVESRDIYHPLAWTATEAHRFLQEIPLYEESGVLVRVPDWWTRRPRPRVAVSIGSSRKGLLGKDALLDFRVELAVGDAKLTPAELKALMAGEDGLVFLKGRWVEVDRERLAEALDHWKEVERQAADGISFVEGMRLLAGAPADLRSAEADAVREWSFITAGGELREILERLRAPQTIEAALPGKELHAVLRHYQESGVRWLGLLAGLGLGACLADDMGLGKTIQVLALLLSLKKEKRGPSLLVLPASLLSNWKAEIERFAPSLKALFVHPSFPGWSAGDGNGAEAVKGFDAVLTTYGMLIRLPWIGEVDWQLVVLDEAQAVKNPGARQTRAVKKLRARARIALTGTPVENRLSDLWSLFDFLCPGLLGSASRFKEFTKGMEKDGGGYAPLRNLVGPYILRRLKTDRSVITDLPEKTEVCAFCGLTRAQALLYKKTVDDLAESLERVEGMQRRGLVLASLLRLKQICNHPSQLRGDGAYEPEDSGKFARLAELCEEIASRQDRALIFTQFREMAEPLASFLAGVFGRSGLVLHGQTPVKERQKLVDAFQADGGPPFFVLSLKAGGTGLNLTAASHVIHFDRWWNPAVENQATDRAFRIGQKKNVLVHAFVCQGTVEEKIDALLREKRAMADELLEGGGEALLTEMSSDELLATVGLDLERACTP